LHFLALVLYFGEPSALFIPYFWQQGRGLQLICGFGFHCVEMFAALDIESWFFIGFQAGSSMGCQCELYVSFGLESIRMFARLGMRNE
jgi:hypothetical protein